ncbi:hypothetical protein ACVWZA_002434 [Sphingomonas sp. UYAg733]
MSRLGFVAYGSGVAGITLLTARPTLDPTMSIYEMYTGDMTTLAVTGWLIATLGPLALSVTVWLLARRVKVQWLLHLVFIPMAFTVFREGASLFFYAAGVSGDSMMDEMALLAATGYLLLALLVHTVALAVIGVTGLRRLAGVR